MRELVGQRHADLLVKGTGDDILKGAHGDDECTGGPGSDTLLTC